MEVDVSGDVIATAMASFGDATVFVGCAKIAQVILANKSIALTNKIGIILSSGATGLTTYKVVSIGTNLLSSDRTPIVLKGSLKLDSVVLSSNASYPIKDHPVLSSIFGMHKDVKFTKLNQPYQITTNPDLGTTTIEATQNNNSIIDTLNSTNPNWRDQFLNTDHIIINSPYEFESEFVNSVIEILTGNLYLSIFSVYLLTMLIVIYICKLLLSPNIEFPKLAKVKIFNWNFGEILTKLLKLYITMWQKSSSFWIFFIIIMVMISLVGITFSTWSILTVLKNIP